MGLVATGMYWAAEHSLESCDLRGKRTTLSCLLTSVQMATVRCDRDDTGDAASQCHGNTMPQPCCLSLKHKEEMLSPSLPPCEDGAAMEIQRWLSIKCLLNPQRLSPGEKGRVSEVHTGNPSSREDRLVSGARWPASLAELVSSR